MRTINNRLPLLLFSIILLCSCEGEVHNDGGISYDIRTRACNAVNVNNAYLEEVHFDGKTEYGRHIDLKKEQIESELYLLRMVVNEKKRDYPYFLYPHIDEIEWDAPDPVMEQELTTYFEYRPKTRANSGKGYADDFQLLEYRTEPLDYIRVMADTTLFGHEAGEYLGDLFDVYGEENPFFFDSDKHLIPLLFPWGTMEEYMSYSPMTPAILYLQLRAKPEEAPVKLRFIVEVKVEGKEPFRDTTRTITLL